MENKDKLKIYLDNCCFNRPYDDQYQLKIELETKAKLLIQKLIVAGKVDYVTSYILEYENNDNPYEIRKSAINDFFKYAIETVNETPELIEQAEEIMLSGLKAKDALHVASAISARCDYFISTDKRLLKYKTDKIELISPLDFIVEMEGMWDE